ncbi:vacuolar membrane-associated protein iml1, partial [Entophlyctis luteolus]
MRGTFALISFFSHLTPAPYNKDGFLPELFAKWKSVGTNHVVSIVLFSRIFYKDVKEFSTTTALVNFDDDDDEFFMHTYSRLPRDFSGRYYRDFYRVVVEWETRSDWSNVLVPLKREFVRFEKDVLLRSSEIDGSVVVSGWNSPACDGNILEAINLALNPFDKHYVDRDLLRTGLAIVVVTASPGFFNVDRKLLRLTTQRMIDNGISCDVVSLAKVPLFSTPLLQFFGKKVHRRLVPNPQAYQSQSGAGVNVNKTSGAMSLGVTQSNLNDVATGQSDGQSSGAQKAKPPMRLPDGYYDPLYFDDDFSFRTKKEDRAGFFNMPVWMGVNFFERSRNSSSEHPTGKLIRGFDLRFRVPEAQLISTDYPQTIIADFMDGSKDNEGKTGSRSTATNASDVTPHVTSDSENVHSPTPSFLYKVPDEAATSQSIATWCERYDEHVFVQLEPRPHVEEESEIMTREPVVGSYSSHKTGSMYSGVAPEHEWSKQQSGVSASMSTSNNFSFHLKAPLVNLEKDARRSSLLSQSSAVAAVAASASAAAAARAASATAMGLGSVPTGLLSASLRSSMFSFADGSSETSSAMGKKQRDSDSEKNDLYNNGNQEATTGLAESRRPAHVSALSDPAVRGTVVNSNTDAAEASVSPATNLAPISISYKSKNKRSGNRLKNSFDGRSEKLAVSFKGNEFLMNEENFIEGQSLSPEKGL